MADEAGAALIAQQKFAAEEPFEEIKANQESIKQAVNSWQVGLQANKARQQLENQMQMMAIKQQEMEADRNLKEREFGVRTAQQQMNYELRANTLENTIQQQGFLNEMRLGKADLDTKKAEFTMGKWQEQADDTTGMIDAAASVASKPGDPTYWSDVLNAVAPFGHGNPTTRGKILGQAGNTHNNAIDAKQKAWDAEKNSLLQDASNQIYGTYLHKGSFDTSIFDKFDKYQPQTKAPDLSWQEWAFGTDKDLTPKPTGNVLIPLEKDGKVVARRPVASSTLTDLASRWKDLQARQPKGQAITDPSVGVYSTPGGTVTIKSSSGKQWTIPQSQLQQAKQLDPGVTIVP